MENPEILRALDTVDVQLVQSQSIGFEGVFRYLPAGILFANASGVHEASTAELALTLILSMQRGIPEFIRQADNGEWVPHTYPSLVDRKVLLVGYGEVSRAIESRLLPFGAQIARIARVPRLIELPDGGEARVFGLGDLMSQLRSSEIVVLAVPLSNETRGLINADSLAAMPDGALLVNVARGGVVDTNALQNELSAGRLRAAIDVVDPEPLPKNHPLWGFPNVLITPHVGGNSGAMMPRMIRLIRKQISNILSGENPENLVQP